MEVPLGEGDLDARLAEGLVDLHVQLVARLLEVADVGNEHPQLEVQRIVAEPSEENEGRWIEDMISRSGIKSRVTVQSFSTR